MQTEPKPIDGTMSYARGAKVIRRANDKLIGSMASSNDEGALHALNGEGTLGAFAGMSGEFIGKQPSASRKHARNRAATMYIYAQGGDEEAARGGR